MFHDDLEIQTRGRGFVDITGDVDKCVQSSGVKSGACVLFVQHTSASLLVQENSDPAVRRDLEKWLFELAPESRAWEHADEGPDDMPAHAKAAVLPTQLTIPIRSGALALGRWQAIYLVEHRQAPNRRRVAVTIF